MSWFIMYLKNSDSFTLTPGPCTVWSASPFHYTIYANVRKAERNFLHCSICNKS